MILNIILSAFLAVCMLANYLGSGITDDVINAASVTAQKCEAADYDTIKLSRSLMPSRKIISECPVTVGIYNMGIAGDYPAILFSL